MTTVHALLVGINEYVAVTKLHGCVADITAVETLLRARVPADALSLQVLHDGAATRAAIIDGFRTHLRKAVDGDIALFYFCGHGSQETCPPEWLALEPSGKNQTIVPVDARTGDVFDIADKELGALIHEVAASGAQVVTLFDSCHSGGVTRDLDDDGDPTGGVARMTAATTGRARTMADYLDVTRELYDPARIAAHGPPAPSHLAITACQHDQTAKEFPKQPPRRGAFTQAFEEALSALGPSSTYTDLVSAIRARVRDRATEQLPSLAAVGTATGGSLFLAGRAGRRDLTIDADAAGAWWLSQGAIGGVPAPESGAITSVAIFPRGAFDDPATTPVPVATAAVDFVATDRARLRLDPAAGPLDTTLQYLATITGLGLVALNVNVSGAPAEEVAAVTTALSAGSGLFAVNASSASTPTVAVQIEAGVARILGADGVPLPNQQFAVDAAGITSLNEACLHLARWYGTRDRTPIASTLNDKVTIEVVPMAAGETVAPVDRAALTPANGVVVLNYAGDRPPVVQFRLRNTASTRLYVALLDLTDSFGCSVKFNDWIPAGGVALAGGGKRYEMSFAGWRDPSFRATTDIMKVFAATEDFSTATLVLGSLLKPKTTGATREAVEEEEPDSSFWGTTTVVVETRR